MNTMLTESSLADEHVIVSECATKVYSKHRLGIVHPLDIIRYDCVLRSEDSVIFNKLYPPS